MPREDGPLSLEELQRRLATREAELAAAQVEARELAAKIEEYKARERKRKGEEPAREALAQKLARAFRPGARRDDSAAEPTVAPEPVEIPDSAWRAPVDAPEVSRPVSIIIPSKDRIDLLARCIASLVKSTDHPDYEIIVVDNGSESPEAAAYYASTPHRVLDFGGPFNFAAMCNYGARKARGESLLFLNNDTEAIEPGWLRAMAAWIAQPGVGAVGACLLYGDRTIQHAGIALHPYHVGRHLFAGIDSRDPGGAWQKPRVCSAVTGACLMISRTRLEEVGGWDEKNLPVSFNDVDLCLRLRRAGDEIIYTPDAKLLHHESLSRGARTSRRETRWMREHWTAELAADPFVR